MSKKGGYYCAFKNCRSLSRRDKRSFFRFPKDPERSKQWVQACNRNDLSEKTPIELFNSYRVCAKHFADSMFLNDLKNRLQPNSVPTKSEPYRRPNDDLLPVNNYINSITETEDAVDNLLKNNLYNDNPIISQTCEFTGMKSMEPVITLKNSDVYSQITNSINETMSGTKEKSATDFFDNIISIDIDNENSNSFSIEALNCLDIINSLPLSLLPSPSIDANELPLLLSNDKTDICENKLPDEIFDNYVMPNITATETENPVIITKLSEITTQTEHSFLKDKITKRKLRKLLNRKKCIIQNLEKRIERNIANDNSSLEQFELLTDKFFPKAASDFIKLQAQLFNSNNKKDNCKKYSPEFKKYCLSMFLAGPKLYKYLQKIFCLPGLQDLQTVKRL